MYVKIVGLNCMVFSCIGDGQSLLCIHMYSWEKLNIRRVIVLFASNKISMGIESTLYSLSISNFIIGFLCKEVGYHFGLY